MATYLVTGCAGFIGWKVCELLLDQGHTVTGVDSLNHAYGVELKQWRLAQLQDRPNFRFAQLDISDREALGQLFQEDAAQTSTGEEPVYHGVINLAARAGVRKSVQDPWVYVDTNITGTLNLLELCKDHGIPKFVLSSTSSLYGQDNPMPYREDASTDRPLSPYAASKKAAEVYSYTYHYLYGLDVTVFRYFTVYGPAGRPDMMPFRMVRWIMEGEPVTVFGDGQQSRDFTYIDDIARGTIAGLKPLGYEIINLGSDTPVVLNDAIALTEELVGKQANRVHAPRHKSDALATWADISKAERLLGWHPQVDFRQGMAALVDWYRENRSWARQVDLG